MSRRLALLSFDRKQADHSGGGTEQVQLESCRTAVDIVADYLDGKGARNRVA